MPLMRTAARGSTAGVARCVAEGVLRCVVAADTADDGWADVEDVAGGVADGEAPTPSRVLATCEHPDSARAVTAASAAAAL